MGTLTSTLRQANAELPYFFCMCYERQQRVGEGTLLRTIRVCQFNFWFALISLSFTTRVSIIKVRCCLVNSFFQCSCTMIASLSVHRVTSGSCLLTLFVGASRYSGKVVLVIKKCPQRTLPQVVCLPGYQVYLMGFICLFGVILRHTILKVVRRGPV